MKVVIYGIKSSAKIIAEILNENLNYQVIGFIGNLQEKKKFKNKKLFFDIPFIGDQDLIPKLANNGVDGFIVGVGDIKLKEKLYYKFCDSGLKPISSISKYALLSSDIKIGKGVTIGKGTIISSNTSIGDNSFIGTGSIMEVSSNVSKNCKISSNVIIGSDSNIDKNVNIGLSATILPNITIGRNNVIKPGKIISKSIKAKLRHY